MSNPNFSQTDYTPSCTNNGNFNYPNPNNAYLNFHTGGPNTFSPVSKPPDLFQFSEQNSEATNQELKDKIIAKKYLDTCYSIRQKAISEFQNGSYGDALKELKKERDYLLEFKKVINQKKPHLAIYLKTISSQLKEIESQQLEYGKAMYEQSTLQIQYRPIESSEYIEKYVSYYTRKPSISYSDIIDETKETKTTVYNIWLKSMVSTLKSLLFYGPKGNGKSLNVLALASSLNCRVVQIESPEVFSVQNFAVNLVKHCFYIQPCILYFKCIENFSQVFHRILFVIEKICEKKDNKILCIISTNLHPKYIDQELNKKIVYRRYFAPCSDKGKYIKFMGERLGIRVNLSEGDCENLNKDLYLYSNEDIKTIMELSFYKKTQLKEEENIDGDALGYDDIVNASEMIPVSFTKKSIEEFEIC